MLWAAPVVCRIIKIEDDVFKGNDGPDDADHLGHYLGFAFAPIRRLFKQQKTGALCEVRSAAPPVYLGRRRRGLSPEAVFGVGNAIQDADGEDGDIAANLRHLKEVAWRHSLGKKAGNRL